MVAMASCSDVVHLENNRSVSCKDVKKQGSYLLSTLLAIVEIFHTLQSLWATLFPFALLWWNAMLYATCAKYYSWNRSRLRLQIAGRHFHNDTIQESPNGEERREIPFSASCADALHVDNREMSVLCLCQEGACPEGVYVEKNDVGSVSHPQSESHHLNCSFGVSIDPFPHQSTLHMFDQHGCAGLHQVEEVVSSTSPSSDAQAIAASWHTCKLSSLCFLEGRWPQSSEPLKGCHWAACSVLLPHQIRPLPMLDVHHRPQIPSDYTCLQVNLQRKGSMLDVTSPMLRDHVSIKCSVLQEGLQTFNGGYVPALNCGKNYQNVAMFSTSQFRNNYGILQFILSTTKSVDIFNTISPCYPSESVMLRVAEQLCSRGFKIKSSISCAEDEDSSSVSSEDLGSVCCTSIVSDDGCNGMHCTITEPYLDKDDRFEDSGVEQCYGGDGYCGYYHGREENVISGVEDAENVNGSFVHPAMDEGDGFYDCSTQCNVGYDGPYCVTDVDGILGMDYDYDAADGQDDVDNSGAVCGHVDLVYEDGVYEYPLEVHVALESKTWWDEGAVLVNKQENEEDRIEQEWELVQV